MSHSSKAVGLNLHLYHLISTTTGWTECDENTLYTEVRRDELTE